MPGPPPPSEFQIVDYLRSIRRHLATVVLVASLFVAAGIGITIVQDPEYRATTQVLVGNDRGSSLSGGGGRSDPVRTAQTERLLIESRAVRDAVRKKYPGAAKVQAEVQGNADVIAVRATDGSARRAAAIANEYAAAYIEFRRAQLATRLSASADEVRSRINRLNSDIADMTRRLDDLAAAGVSTSAEADRLRRERDNAIGDLGTFRERLDQIEVEAATISAGAEVISTAVPPGSPASPQPLRTIPLAALLGVVVGSAVAIVRDRGVIQTTAAAARIAGELPVLGVIPVDPEAMGRNGSRPIVTSLPESPAAVSYRELSLRVRALLADRPHRILQIASPSSSTDAAVTSANLGVALADAGVRTLLVSGDAKHGCLHELFDLGNTSGLTYVLAGWAKPDQAMRYVKPNLCVMPAGPVPPGKSSAVAAKDVTRLLHELGEEFDVVLFDAPAALPNGALADPPDLPRAATALVVRAGTTSDRELRRAVNALAAADVPIIGLVVKAPVAPTGFP